MSTLVILLDIGDEDGPSLSYWLTSQPINGHVVITSMDSNNTIINRSKYIDSTIGFYQMIHTYNITNVVEIHDWYDYINYNDVIQKQTSIDARYLNPILPKDNTISYVMVTAVGYNQDPVKYLIPIQEYHRIDDYDKFSNLMYKYLVTASYYDILTRYKVLYHDYYLLDICNDENRKLCTSDFVKN